MPLAAWPAICDLYRNELSPVLGDRRRLRGVRDGAKLLKAGPSTDARRRGRSGSTSDTRSHHPIPSAGRPHSVAKPAAG